MTFTAKKPTYKELAEHLQVSESAVKQYNKEKRRLMIMGLWLDKETKMSTCNNKTKKLEDAIRSAISAYKKQGGENNGAFSLDVKYDDGDFKAKCVFDEDTKKIVMYGAGDDQEEVQKIFDLKADLCEMADLLLSEGWVQKGEGLGPSD